MSKYETVYRIVKNKDSNDFNNELEFTIEPYYINKDNTKIQRKGFDSWNDITAEIFDSIYWNRKSAERALVSWCEDQKIADLEAKLTESEKLKESYRLQNDEHHLQLCQFYSRLGVEAFGADIHEKALETLMIMKEELEEKNGVRRALSACNRQNDEFADMIKKLVGEKEELKQQLFESGLKTLEEINLSEQRKKMLEDLSTKNWELEQQLAESEEKLNQYPYKNDVIEKQYEELKDGIKFRVKNNITDDWEQLYHCIDVLCEKHKARIRDIENSICSIDQLKQQLEEKESKIETLKQRIDAIVKIYSDDFVSKDTELKELRHKVKQHNQDKISFALEQLEKARQSFIYNYNNDICCVDPYDNHCCLSLTTTIYNNTIDIFNNQIKQLKEQ